MAPQPGLADLSQLIEQTRQAGFAVSLTTDGLPSGLPARVELSAYRIIQECLTNVVKHAGPGTRTEVRVTCDGGCVVLDVTDDGRGPTVLPGSGHGIIGMREPRIIEELDGAVRVLILTTFEPDEYVYEALRAGASGFVLKDIPPEQLVSAVRTVAEGGALLAPSITRRLIGQFAAQRSVGTAASAQLAQLTGRERDVVIAVARGSSNADIARGLFIGPATVKSHVSSVLTKLGLRDRAQIVVFAYESGLVAAGDGSVDHRP